MVYVGGCYVGMLIEQGLRATGHSVQDVFHALLATGKPYTLTDVLSTIQRQSSTTRKQVEQVLKQHELDLSWQEFHNRMHSLDMPDEATSHDGSNFPLKEATSH